MLFVSKMSERTETVLHEMRSDILFAVDRNLVDMLVNVAFHSIDNAIFLS
jgi:hypothetical protein